MRGRTERNMAHFYKYRLLFLAQLSPLEDMFMHLTSKFITFDLLK